MKGLSRIGLPMMSIALLWAGQAAALTIVNTGAPDGKIATASRPTIGIPGGPGYKMEIESADDFLLASPTSITGGTFTGLLTGGATIFDINWVGVEIYHVFPKDSTNPPGGNVPTRVNSPSDVKSYARSSSADLSFNLSTLSPNFTASNSVKTGINPSPNQTTGGEGPVSGQEILFEVTFTTPFLLPADHYFFVPLVEVTSGEFYWLSAPKPIVLPGIPFIPDLQTWIRNETLAPDWLRVGTDIVGGQLPPTFNASFSLNGQASGGQTVPEPTTVLLLGSGLLGLAGAARRKRKT